MALVNENYLRLQGRYLFSEIAGKVNAFRSMNPDKKLISMGIGDVTKPLAGAVIDAMHKAVDEMASANTFRGYGPEQGYRFLVEKIIECDFEPRGVRLNPDEVFVSDGCKSDMGNIGGILAKETL